MEIGGQRHKVLAGNGGIGIGNWELGIRNFGIGASFMLTFGRMLRAR